MDASGVIYHGKLCDIAVKAGETKEVRLKPAGHTTALKIKVEKDPYWSLGELKDVAPVMITRRSGLLAWACRNFHHPEDQRLGRVFDNFMTGALLMSLKDPDTLRMVEAKGRRAWLDEGGEGRVLLVAPDLACTLRNFPPGEYAVFTYAMGMYKDWKSPAIYLRGVKAVVSPGKEETVEIPWVEPIGPSSINTRVFYNEVTLEAKDYSSEEICELLTKESGAKPGEMVVDSAIEGEKVALAAAKLQIWDLLETIYMKKGWKLEADYKARRLVLRPS